MSLRMAESLLVLVLTMTVTFLWLDARRDAKAPPGAESGATISSDTPGPMAASDAAFAEAASAGTAARPTPAADARYASQSSSPVNGELAIEWSRASAVQASDRMLKERRLQAASGLIAGSRIPGHPDYDGSLGFATPGELQQRFDAEVRDQEWARAAERQAELYLDSHPFRGIYGPLALECKATLCRFAAVASGEALGAYGRDADWQTIMNQMLRDPAFAMIFSEHRDSMMVNNDLPGQVGYLTWLRRQQPPEG